jgi:hypothetical protein
LYKASEHEQVMPVTLEYSAGGYDHRMLAPRAMYSRTQNENGSYNSRCLDCFMTIASCIETEAELDEREAHHMCPEKALAQLMAEGRAKEAQASRN